ncbi:hypothetical protein HYALB_00005703 [Hymenoscyphus albidus]|uniref:Uncharacterized protein n=1 Tax=Hymenoscyphus albidus TaxID=595503 RepID=A0A9N9LPN2_9HELO|nr:hypothetical protein HYALB_00005703 [Hymenoscyphus albidus]
MLTFNIFTAAAVLSTFVAGLPLPPTRYGIDNVQFSIPPIIATEVNHDALSKRAPFGSVRLESFKNMMAKIKPLIPKKGPFWTDPSRVPKVKTPNRYMEKLQILNPWKNGMLGPKQPISPLKTSPMPVRPAGAGPEPPKLIEPEAPTGPKFRPSMFPKTPAGANQEFHFAKLPSSKENNPKPEAPAKAAPPPEPPLPKPLPADAPGPLFRESMFPKMPAGANQDFHFAKPPKKQDDSKSEAAEDTPLPPPKKEETPKTGQEQAKAATPPPPPPAQAPAVAPAAPLSPPPPAAFPADALGPQFRQSMFPQTPAGANQHFHFAQPPKKEEIPKTGQEQAKAATPPPPPKKAEFPAPPVAQVPPVQLPPPALAAPAA